MRSRPRTSFHCCSHVTRHPDARAENNLVASAPRACAPKRSDGLAKPTLHFSYVRDPRFTSEPTRSTGEGGGGSSGPRVTWPWSGLSPCSHTRRQEPPAAPAAPCPVSEPPGAAAGKPLCPDTMHKGAMDARGEAAWSWKPLPWEPAGPTALPQGRVLLPLTGTPALMLSYFSSHDAGERFRLPGPREPQVEGSGAGREGAAVGPLGGGRTEGSQGDEVCSATPGDHSGDMLRTAGGDGHLAPGRPVPRRTRPGNGQGALGPASRSSCSWEVGLL